MPRLPLSVPTTLAHNAKSGQRGFTLVELVMVIVLLGVIGGMVSVFMRSPIDAYFASARRAGLTDVADTAMRRISRDLNKALPNSIRTASNQCVEFIPTKTGGRYRAEVDASGAGNPLDFSAQDSGFDVLGDVSSATVSADQQVASGDWVVVYNLGIDGSDAYGLDNVALVKSVSSTAGISTLLITEDMTDVTNAVGKQFPFESDGKRFHVVPGSEPAIAYVCANLGAAGVHQCKNQMCLYRVVTSFTLPYAAPASCPQPVAATPVLATKLSACDFDYSGSDLQRNALVRMRFTFSESGENISLQQDVHVNNAP